VPPELLSVEGLHKTYGHGDIFSDVTFTLRGGETIGLFGMSGSGKSTLSRCILGLERPTHGKIRFEGLDNKNEAALLLRNKTPDPNDFSAS